MSKEFATTIIQTLRQRGFQAYLAGGCVRDLLLQREPADYDIATSATPAEVMEILLHLTRRRNWGAEIP